MKSRMLLSPATLSGALGLLITGVALLPATADAGTSATTVPVGVFSQPITPAVSATTPTYTSFSVPFYKTASYSSLLTSVDSSTSVSCSTATWTTNQFSTTPSLIHFKSGSSLGRYFLIKSNTSKQITVYPRTYTLTSILKSGDSFEIIPANTLANLFSGAQVSFQTGSTSGTADDIMLWNGTGYDTYYNNGSNWKVSGSDDNQNNTVIYPDEGMLVLRRNTHTLTVNLVGTVPATLERSDVVGPGSTQLGNRFPVATTLNGLGLQALPGWKKSASPSSADTVSMYVGTDYQQFYYNGTNWVRNGAGGTYDSLAIPIGGTVFVTRQSRAVNVSADLDQSLPYSLK